MSDDQPILKTRISGFDFPECPRWHDGHLWFSDMHGNRIIRWRAGGSIELIVKVPQGPGGLGWLPDGRLLVVSMQDRKLMRLDGKELTEVADLSEHASWHCNDMVVDQHGRAYIGNFGFDLQGGSELTQTCLMLVEPDGTVHRVAEGLSFPNGMVITPDGKTLIVAESFARRLTAFDIEDDGWLSGGRVWADLSTSVPDGICLDDAGGIWVADPVGHQVFRVVEGGEITDSHTTGDHGAYACMLGGDDHRTLYVCTAQSSDPATTVQEKEGRIQAVSVDQAGAGLP